MHAWLEGERSIVAQLIECPTHDQEVVGFNPTKGVKLCP